MQTLKPFLVGKTDILRQASFCWICGNAMKAGTTIAICRYGNRDQDWEKAHLTCATDSPLNAQSESVSVVEDGVELSWQLLDRYEGRKRYALYINGAEVIRSAARDRVEGMVELLGEHPEAVRAIMNSAA
jgi:hypothetical protein